MIIQCWAVGKTVEACRTLVGNIVSWASISGEMKDMATVLGVMMMIGMRGEVMGAAGTGILKVQAGPHDRTDTPMVVAASSKELLGEDIPPERLARMRLELVEVGGSGAGKTIPAQWQLPADPPMTGQSSGALAFILTGKTPAGTERRFRLQPVQGGTATATTAIEDEKGKWLMITCGGKPVARYNYGVVQKDIGKPSLFDRPAYFHPVWSPSGKVISDDFPRSHPHQRGLFFAWTRATIGGYQADFWNLGAGKGKTIHKRLSNVDAGSVFAGFVAENVLEADRRVVIHETFCTRVYGQGDGPWILDVHLRHTATDRPVVLDKYHYGGMAFRGRPDWFGDRRPEIVASDAYDAKQGAGDHARWVDMVGMVPGGGLGGLAMFDCPSNPPYPTAIRAHPQVPYFCFAFAVHQPYTIEAGRSLELRYRCVIHDGAPNRTANDRWATDFAHPPKATIESGN